MSHPVILFDGVCNFCNGIVNFIISRDKRKIFRFAPLQSEKGRELLEAFHFSPGQTGTIVLVDNRHVYSKSTAALKILNRLGGFWKTAYFLIIIPPFLRDAIYDFIARNRYRWFGKRSHCMVPAEEVRERFL